MGRPLRLEFPGAVYHITARGNAKQVVFIRQDDYHTFLSILNDVREEYDWRIHAYCLMPNHYHLLLQTLKANLSVGMKYLNGVYAQTFNRKHANVGHVFQGRFKSILVEMDSYAIELARYIALNPVRAGLVSRPSQWSWSSYKATIGRSPRPRFLSTDWVLEQFSSQKPESRKAFRRFVLDGIDAEAPWKDLRGGVILGGEEFVKTMEGRFRARKKTKGVSQRERFANRLTLEQIFAGKEKRPVCARTVLTAQLDHGYTLKSIADFLKVTPSTITRAVQNLKSRN